MKRWATALVIGVWILSPATARAEGAGPPSSETRFATISTAFRFDSRALVRIGASHEATQGDAPADSTTIEPSDEVPIGVPVALGLAGMIVGAAMGAGIGEAVAPSDCDGEFICIHAGAAIGGLVGEAVLLPVGVHLGNRSRGDFWSGLSTSIGVLAAGIGLTVLTDSAAPAALLPFVQLIACVAAERKTDGR